MKLKSQNAGHRRVTKIFLFNSDCELELKTGSRDYKISEINRELMEDFSLLPQFLAEQDDVVWCSKLPSQSYLEKTKKLGYQLPRFVEIGTNKDLSIADYQKFDFNPWGWTPRMVKIGEEISGDRLNRHYPLLKEPYAKLIALYNKGTIITLRKKLREFIPSFPQVMGPSFVDGLLLSNEKQIIDYVLENEKKFGLPTVVKETFGAAGSGLILLNSKNIGDETVRCRLSQAITGGNEVVVEPWLNRLYDISSLIEIRRDGKVGLLGMTQFYVDRVGKYCRHRLGSVFPLVSFGSQRQHPSVNSNMGLYKSTLKETALFIGRLFSEMGFRGLLGIDSYIYRFEPVEGRGHWFINPLGEVNPRTTMGHVVLALQKRVRIGVKAIWLTITRQLLTKMGYASFVALEEEWTNRHSCRLERGEESRIDRGLFLPMMRKMPNTYWVVWL